MNKEIKIIFPHEQIRRLQNSYKLNASNRQGIDNVFLKLTNNKAYMSITNGYQALKFDITTNVIDYHEIDDSMLEKEYTFKLPVAKTRKKDDYVKIIITESEITAKSVIGYSDITETLTQVDYQFFDRLEGIFKYDKTEYSEIHVDIDNMIQVLQGLKNKDNKIVTLSIDKENKYSPLQFSLGDNDKALLLPRRIPD